ncbi:MAG TPA: bifunctional oligoribonuclease/PAP phosphatase NrnA [Gemmatimonadales bacterium]|nr:bifunctional oligoribonuclease/PAP phosphatase NrnA [Gemmatimonadales bacterium]
MKRTRKRSKTAPTAADSGRVAIPTARRRAALQVADLLKPGLRVALTTHVNADGDGAGAEVALWHLLTARGVRAAITNPTPFPDRYAFLLRGTEHADKTGEAVRHLRRADAVVVLDISDVGRLGQLGTAVQEIGVPVACVDHHATNGSLPAGPRLVDAAACATGELVFDLARVAGWPLVPDAARALYVAILTDTGGFRFSNTSPRALRVAADLLGQGLNAEEIYREVYATASEGRIRLTADVLETLVVEPEVGLAWVTVPPGALERYGVESEDLEGVVEFPRSIRGVRLALLFRQIAGGRIKVSFRSVGDVDVAQLAGSFGGGGHTKAAGASLHGTLAEAQERVLTVARQVLRRIIPA